MQFHPLVDAWFRSRFAAPSPAQEQGWARIAAGSDTLIAAPTGSGKTLAAFLWSINCLVAEAANGKLGEGTRVIYTSPLKALSNDIQINLQQPLAEIRALAPMADIRVAVRTGDTPQAERQTMLRRPPHILVTTPETLHIMMTAERSREFLRGVETVIVDEIHAVAGDKRGAHLALSLERLDLLSGRRVQRIGLSATQKPIQEVARLLIGTHRDACEIVDVGHRRRMRLEIEVPDQDLGPIASHELWDEVYDRIVTRVNTHRTTLVFVNTRRLVERVAHQLAQRLGDDAVAAHHGSLSRERRQKAEQKLKRGEVKVVVATASLELGIDIGHVDVVCHVGSPRALATLVQRVGRSGHWLGAIPHGVLYPLTRDDLMQCTAAVRAVRAGELDTVTAARMPLDVLAQQMVATVASENDPNGFPDDALYALAKASWPYRELPREDFDRLLDMLTEGVASARGRRSAHLHRDRVNGVLYPRRGARMAAITNGGAIPDTADYDVIELPAETIVGRVNEDFAIESMAGDIFLLGNRSWRIARVGSGRVLVEDAQGAPPTIPFWLGEAPARTPQLSEAVSDLRKEVVLKLETAGPRTARQWLQQSAEIPEAAADQVVAYVEETLAALGVVPTTDCVVAERFFDEAGGMQLVVHAPFGGRINRAWGLALRKRFCVTFDFELQAAATDDGIVISLGERHSFPLPSVFGYVRPETLEGDLTQAALQSPMFGTRWRWNATRALAVPRSKRGKKVPLQIQRMQAEDLLAAAFPDATMCQDNRSGPIEPNDHPLVVETLQNCLHEVMDLDGMRDIARRLQAGEIRTVAVETSAPSPMSHEILNANPYAFLDDAPLEERRARAVSLRRTDSGLAGGIGRLSQEAIDEVCAQAWPLPRDPNEMHDVLLGVGVLPDPPEQWLPYLHALTGRAAEASWTLEDGTPRTGWVAAERVHWLKGAFPDARVPLQPMEPPDEDAVKNIARGWMDILGPVTERVLAAKSGLSRYQARLGTAALEASGVILQGHFRGEIEDDVEWCERGLLARIHRLTLGRLRREIEPVTPADFMRFLLHWQHVAPGTRLHGRDGVLYVIRQLQGLELPAPAWEESILPARVQNYDPMDLEYLCLSGTVTWGRLRPRASAPTRGTALAFALRADLPWLRGEAPDTEGLSAQAEAAHAQLATQGASFLADLDCSEGSLWELVSRGLVSGDGVAGLRALLSRNESRPRPRLRALPAPTARHLPTGRWSLWRPPTPVAEDERLDRIARQLLARHGVVFRDLLARETLDVQWRPLLHHFRTLEARGEIRGGRFVDRFIGEQFALPDAVDALRALRRSSELHAVILSAADPLNLVGIVTPGARISPYSSQRLTFHAGVQVDAGPVPAQRSH
ncbi:MAG: DEAD/DEAH box helicase [Armatimonadetes bacterium]|nr:DEAD/DEAH box helicase [Armatimonadota bacterium]